MPYERYDRDSARQARPTKTLSAMIERYGEKRGKQVFYATVNSRRNERRARGRS